MVLVAPAGGWLADRHDRRTMMLVGVAALVFFLATPLVNSSAEVLLRRNVANDELAGPGVRWG